MTRDEEIEEAVIQAIWEAEKRVNPMPWETPGDKPQGIYRVLYKAKAQAAIETYKKLSRQANLRLVVGGKDGS